LTTFPSNLCWNSLSFMVSCFSAATSRERLRGSLYRHF
jgi:hypothetical protein